MIGTSLGPYKIIEQLGAGGMGEVYRARDTKLERDVAIKVLPDDLAADPDRLARFEREAKLLAALNHANVGSIHGLEETDGVHFLVLELIEGESLERRLQRGPIPVPEALDIARQIAEALEAAHDAGIIHRDVKPANVLLTAKGGVKVLDFGIAKSTLLDGAANGALTEQATSLTVDGTLMGTPPYMSPEQIRGQEADKRADIWALGCVLYEMLAGRRAFDRETVADTLAAILESEPDWRTLPSDLPPALESLLRRALAKDPGARLHHAADARIEIEEAQRAAVDDAVSPTRSRSPVLALAVVSIAALALFAYALSLRSSGDDERPPLETWPLTSRDGYEEVPVLSPDGQKVIFFQRGGGGPRVPYIKVVDRGGQAVPLIDESLPGTRPAWSPAGDRIALVRRLGDEWEIFTVTEIGTGEQSLTVEPCRPGPLEWTPDGEHLIFLGCPETPGGSRGLVAHSLRDSSKIQLTDPPTDRAFSDVRPSISPDGSHLAFVRQTQGGADMVSLNVVRLGGDRQPIDEPIQLASPNANIRGVDWVSDSTAVVYSEAPTDASSYLVRVPIDGRSRPARLAVGERAQSFSIVGERLVYTRHGDDRDIWQIGGPLADAPGTPQKWNATNLDEGWQSYSPDGSQVTFASDRDGTLEVYVANADGTGTRRITRLGWANLSRFSPDGSRIAFNGIIDGESGSQLYTVDVRGSEEPRIMTDWEFGGGRGEWSDDGWIYFNSRAGGRVPRIWRVPSSGGVPQAVVEGGSVPQVHEGRVFFIRGIRDGDIWSVGLEGGDEKLELDASVTHTNWAPWKGYLVYMEVAGPTSGVIKIHDLATEETKEHLTVQFAAPIGVDHHLAVSPDGLHILYSGHSAAGSDLVVADNYR